jgi:hypothetical protein
MRRESLAFAFVLITACSGSSSVDGPTIDQACTDAANAVCQRYQGCSAALISFAYGDIASCQTRAALQCKTRLASPDQGNSPSNIEGCVAKVPQISCQNLYSGDVPSECLPPAGARAAGAACGDDAQCQSAFCAVDTDRVCGTCQTAPAAGAPCAGGRCGPGFVCNTQTKCVRPGAVSSACDGASPCTFGLACFKGKCVAAPGDGAPCDPLGATNPTCDFTQALYCDVSSHACRQAPFGKAGDACGLVDNAYRACIGTTYCNATTALGKGTCQPKAADGAACSTDVSAGAPCLAPAVCNGGTCVIGDPATCH